MSNILKHTGAVVEKNEFCPERHEEDFTEVGVDYSAYTDELLTNLVSDLQPEQIVPGGSSLAHYMNSPSAAFVGDFGSTTATLERWAMTEDTLIRVSKTASWHGFSPMTRIMAKQVLNRRSIIPGSKQRRVNTIVGEIMAKSPGRISIDEFQLPEGEISDGVIFNMRRASDSWFSNSDVKPKHHTSTDPDLVHLPSEDILHKKAYDTARRRLAYEAAHKEVGPVTYDPEVDSLDVRVLSRAFQLVTAQINLERTIEPAADDVEIDSQRIIHDQLEDLIIATDSLRRAVRVIREGKTIIPSAPQNTCPEIVMLASISVRGSKTVKLDGGREITLSIT